MNAFEVIVDGDEYRIDLGQPDRIRLSILESVDGQQCFAPFAELAQSGLRYRSINSEGKIRMMHLAKTGNDIEFLTEGERKRFLGKPESVSIKVVAPSFASLTEDIPILTPIAERISAVVNLHQNISLRGSKSKSSAISIETFCKHRTSVNSCGLS